MRKLHESMATLTPAYVIGLLADVEPRASRAEARLEAAEREAEASSRGMQALLSGHAAGLAAVREATAHMDNIGARLGELNQRVAVALQETATFRRRADELKIEMQNAPPRGEVQRQLRRERGSMLAEAQDREAQIARARQEATELRSELRAAQQALVQAGDAGRAASVALDAARDAQPPPELYLTCFQAEVARAHGRMFLDRDVSAWRAQINAAAARLQRLYEGIAAHRYRLDRHSEVVGGRAWASGEAAYALVAAGRPDVALRLFNVVGDADLYFHQIFNIFRVWALGLLLQGRLEQLGGMLSQHAYSEGLRGGYVEAFFGLLARDTARLNGGLRDIVRLEWAQHSGIGAQRGVAVVNVAACALARVALEQGLAVDIPAPSVPEEILLAPSP